MAVRCQHTGCYLLKSHALLNCAINPSRGLITTKGKIPFSSCPRLRGTTPSPTPPPTGGVGGGVGEGVAPDSTGSGGHHKAAPRRLRVSAGHFWALLAHSNCSFGTSAKRLASGSLSESRACQPAAAAGSLSLTHAHSRYLSHFLNGTRGIATRKVKTRCEIT